MRLCDPKGSTQRWEILREVLHPPNMREVKVGLPDERIAADRDPD